MSNLQILNSYQIIEQLQAENTALQTEIATLKAENEALKKGTTDDTLDTGSN